MSGLVADASVGEHRHLHVLGPDLPDPLQKGALVHLPPALQLGLHPRLPDQRGGPAVVRDHQQHKGVLVGGVEGVPGQGGDALGLQVAGKKGGHERRDPVAVERLVAHDFAA
jgi:hypothetical protein